MSKDPRVLLQCILCTLSGSAENGVGLERETTTQSGDYIIPAGFVHCMVYLPSGVTATVDGIPLEGPTTYTLESNFPARHSTPVEIDTVAGGDYYVSETR